MDYFATFGGIHEILWQENLKTLRGNHETQQKKFKLELHLCWLHCQYWEGLSFF